MNNFFVCKTILILRKIIAFEFLDDFASTKFPNREAFLESSFVEKLVVFDTEPLRIQETSLWKNFHHFFRNLWLIGILFAFFYRDLKSIQSCTRRSGTENGTPHFTVGHKNFASSLGLFTKLTSLKICKPNQWQTMRFVW